MKRLWALCFRGGVPKTSESPDRQETRQSMANPESSNRGAGNSEEASRFNDGDGDENIILNPWFEDGLNNWSGRGCKIVLHDSMADGKVLPLNGKFFASATERSQNWNGIQQEITGHVQRKLAYEVAAVVRIFGNTSSADVRATLWAQAPNLREQYIGIANLQATDKEWATLQGKFLLNAEFSRLVIYLEGPPPGTDILVNSLVVKHAEKLPPSPPPNTEASKSGVTHGSLWANIITNHDFSEGLSFWHTNCCQGYVITGEPDVFQGVKPNSGKCYAVISNRTQCWQGLEQDITDKVSPHCTYSVTAYVRVWGPILEHANVQATLRLEYSDGKTSYLFVGRSLVLNDSWEKLEGSFSLEIIPKRVVFYLEGPSPGVDLLVDSVLVTSFSLTKCKGTHMMPAPGEDECIIRNPRFEDALNHWSGRGCKILLNNSISDANRNIAPLNGKAFASAVERRESWNGIQQDITSRVKRKVKYEVCAVVRIFGAQSADVRLTLWVQTPNIREKYMGIAKEQASDQEWMKLHGKFLLSNVASKVIIFLEGPPPGVDILVDSLVIKEAEKLHLSHPPVYENILFGVSIVENSNLHNGLVGWHPLGSCTLSVGSGSPLLYPPIARESLELHGQLSGRYIRVTNRTETWMGPAQTITDKLKMHITYQVSAWVRIGYRQSGSQNINVALAVDGQWINGGQAEVHDERWHEIMGSFRLEKQPSKVNIHVQGPSAGVDLMIAGLQVFPVNRQARFERLNKQIDKIRKRDVVLKFSGANMCNVVGASIKVTQRHNSFPFGSSLCLTDLENDDLADFFVKNFNWAVFGNELKWYWTESQKGKFNYNDADELIRFCNKHGKQMRGHCIFWEVEDSVQQWVRSLNRNELMEAVQNRLTGLLLRYKGKFRHYDVNNEMLHGSFFKDRLGSDIHSNMFKMAHQLDPSATLFVNDYNVEDGCDGKSSPEMYIQQILDLQEQGAPVGGIGLQGHISNPIGHVICAALDKLAILGLPIWFTELDVSAVNEHVRADDLEVVLREAFAHSAVEGIVLWGFWELLMFRDNAHLVDAEGRINEAGKRYLALMKEWLTHAEGYIDQQGQFRFRGFHGAYTLEISGSKSLSKTFIVEKGDHPLQVQISI
ncbi:hypothetical protein QJS10_CPB13g00036 [Acorus calamus]|uniref:GH10 domain-containing protein n=1 Tax=Acorus calamus TaxID=4465 RepID=A0AAV9DHC8_ACOCL|nr:hypothetical protein QJS10_CPB13g00036 [Acorus calamus]